MSTTSSSRARATGAGSASASQPWLSNARGWLRDAVATLPPYRKFIGQVVDAVPMTSRSILVVGCGTGVILRALQQSRPGARFAGLDQSPAMIQRARLKVPVANLTVASLEKTFPYAKAIFDAVVCIDVLHSVTSPNRMLAECRRVLRPGGVLIATHPEDRVTIVALVRAQLRSSRRSKSGSTPLRLVSFTAPAASSGTQR